MEVGYIEVIENNQEFIRRIFDEAIEKGTSDIHFEPCKEYMIIRFRIDGDLFDIYKISKDNISSIINAIKILSQLKIDETRNPQDGEITYQYLGKDDENEDDPEDIDMRVSSLPTLYGEKIVIRILRKDESLLDLNSLGFLQINLMRIKKVLKQKEGIILVSGPTGSGKTTTLYSILNYFDPKEHNISTLENPVEYKINRINQSQVKPEIGFTFSEGLKSLLRQDPDIIMVGEIRDTTTAKLAIEAAMTGHIVLGTIHANAGIGVINRLINMGIDPYLIASSLNLVVSQRLVKGLCDCSSSKDLVDDETDILKKGLRGFYDDIKQNINANSPEGCEKCLTTGYKGRIAIQEVIQLDDDFNKIIVGDLNKTDWLKLMSQKQQLNLYQDGLVKSAIGKTALPQVLPYKIDF